MISSDDIVQLASNSDYQSRLTDHILDYTNKAIELQEFISQNIRQNTPLAKLFFTKIKPFSPEQLILKGLHKDSYLTDIRDVFALNSRLFPIILFDAIPLHKRLDADSAPLVMRSIISNLSTVVDFLLLNLDNKFKEVSESPSKLQNHTFSGQAYIALLRSSRSSRVCLQEESDDSQALHKRQHRYKH